LTRWRYAAATDTGLVRDLNEDALYVDELLAVVADGMGGHAAGEVASDIAVQVVRDQFAENPTVEGLYRGIETAHRIIQADARENPDHFGMGTTVIVVGLTVDSSGVRTPTLFNVGDSRAYQLRDGAIRQLSEDHSVAEEWVRMGRLTPEEAAVHPRRHQLTRTLGIEDMLEIDVQSVHATLGDRLLLCSDGLSNELSNESLAQLASAPIPLEEAVRLLVDGARAAGGHDNISAILLEFDEVDETVVPIKRTVSTTPRVPEVGGDGSRRARRARRVTWRSVLAVVVLLLVAGAFVGVMHWYAYSTYYLGDDGGRIAVYRGQPHGVLWFKPVKVRDTSYRFGQLRPADQGFVRQTIEEPTLQAALNYAAYLHRSWALGQPSNSTTTTTTTTTTAPGTSPTTTVGG
jgi:protein phosphatase